MAFATLTRTERGTSVRLTNYGFAFATMPVAVQLGEEPTEAADRLLAEHGWVLTDQQWEPTFGGITGQVWTAEVDMVNTQTPTT